MKILVAMASLAFAVIGCRAYSAEPTDLLSIAGEMEDLEPTVAPPQPQEISNVVSFSRLKDFWDHASVATDLSSHLGEWKLIARAYSPGCGFFMKGEKKEIWNPQGVQNKDGSMELLRLASEDTIDLEGKGAPTLVVSLANMRKKSRAQRVKANTGEPQFARWAYSQDDSIDHSKYFSFSCRIIEGQSQHLICTESLTMSNGVRPSSAVNNCLQEGISLIEAFKKQDRVEVSSNEKIR
ncbi:MAG: hypothetical protein C5B49_07050 [Bdellovibrio sp.]|nr:MAG: hypothetical protein C5B49_07050 [Bdellovibrio sp.]